MKPVLPRKMINTLQSAIAIMTLCVVAVSGLPTAAHAACANPVGAEGKIIYNEAFSTLQFCDDTNWIAMDGATPGPLKITGVGDWEATENDFLSWTPGTAASNNTMQTFSFWYKRESAGAQTNQLFASWPGGPATEASWAAIPSDNRIYIGLVSTTNQRLQLYTAANTFADTSSWHHILIQFDVASGTLTEKIKLWHDGVSIPLSVSGGDNAPLTVIHSSLMSGSQQTVGAFPGSTSNDFDGLIAEFHAIDGALVPLEAFYSGGRALAYNGPHGNNGFYLNFSNAVNLGQDFGGRGNNFTNTGVTQNVDQYPISGNAPANLIRRWEFETRTGGNIIDSVGGLSCVLGGVHSTVPGRFTANGIRFDNGNASCSMGTSLNGLSEVTLTGWARRTAANDKAFFGSYPNANNNIAINIENDAMMYFYVSNGSSAGGGYAQNDGSWHHVALVFNGSLTGNANRLRAYVDGLPVTLSFTGTIPATTGTGLGTLFISGDTSATWDDARIYSRALSQVEIQSIMGLCSSPAGDAGDIIYSSTLEAVQYCNGTAWAHISPQRTVPNANNLVAHYKFDHSSGTVLTDHAGAHTGTLTNFTLPAAWTAGQIGSNSLNFDGTDDFVSLANVGDFAFSATGQYTWAVWINPDDFEEWNAVFGAFIGANAEPTFAINAHTSVDNSWGPVTAGVSAGIDQVGVRLDAHSTNNVLTVGTWSHVTVTYDGTQAAANRFKIYVNALDVTSNDVQITGSIGNTTFTNVRIGNNGWTGDSFDGRIDDLRFYTRLLSGDEIRMLASYGPVTGSCANPTATAGKMIYNNVANVVQFCNGRNWIAAGR